jgi:hypothetical protein
VTRRGTAIGMAAVLGAIMFAADVAALAVLPRLSADERLVVRMTRMLAAETFVATTGRARAVTRSCRVLPRRRELVWPADRRPFIMAGAQPKALDGTLLPTSLRKEAFLAGCPRLIGRAIGVRLRRAQHVYDSRTDRGSANAFHLVVSDRPPVRLVVTVHGTSLRPTGVHYGRETSVVMANDSPQRGAR